MVRPAVLTSAFADSLGRLAVPIHTFPHLPGLVFGAGPSAIEGHISGLIPQMDERAMYDLLAQVR